MPGTSVTPTRKLKAKDVDNFTALPKERRYLNDEVSPLVVRAFGQKRKFVVRGRLPKAGAKYGKTVELVLPIPARGETLASARHIARQWKDMMAEGKDPRDGETAPQSAQWALMDAASDARQERLDDNADASTIAGWDWLVQALNDCGRGLEKRPFDDITVSDLEGFLERVRDRARGQRRGVDGAGAYNEGVKWLRAVFNHAVRKQHARTNLADNLRKRRIADGRKHVQPTPDPLSESATAALWRLLRHSEGVPERFLGVVLLTGLRADEAASLEWRHIRFDWPEPAIVIPPDERKAGVGVELPLTDLLHWYLADAGAQEGTPYVFPSVSASSGHVWRNQPKAQDRLSRQIEGHPAISPQRLRQTVRSGLARLGVEREVAEHVLGHGEGGIGRSYQGDTMYGRKLEALKAWHRRLDELAGIA